MQTVLHVLFLPTPFKVLSQTIGLSAKKESQTPIDASDLKLPEEVLRPGSLYAECAMVQLKITLPQDAIDADKRTGQQKKEDKKGKGKAPLTEEVLDIVDDGEYGGELAGRLVWESYEQALKIWEKDTTPTERDKEREKVDQERRADVPEPTPANMEDQKNFY